MTTILIILQVFITFCLIVAVLLQKTSSDSLAGLSSSGHSVLSSKSSRNIFTKATIILGIAFMLNSLLIAKFYVSSIQSKTSIVKSIEKDSKEFDNQTPEAPAATE
jgi:preprotein translocase subunit SecG